ncbi:MAG: 4Fe-4S dicluster domain-containing protein [Candidatus Thermoplasmatota archaeon]|jgi:2-oxoglutarate ferredoxin oxidoreductase subunit delta|nr:4Fe-4S dicluster domain-containing protein [Candidatus Thermoplasmatota archaeon]MCL5963619.1 4Fe-4S dicluster domain-containing protein [Candidatus Thermoplasmatota archaeon]
MLKEKAVKAYVDVNEVKCKGCEICVISCPFGNLELDKERFNKNGYHPVVWSYEGKSGVCTACGICYYVCPDYAIATIKKVRAV